MPENKDVFKIKILNYRPGIIKINFNLDTLLNLAGDLLHVCFNSSTINTERVVWLNTISVFILSASQ